MKERRSINPLKALLPFSLPLLLLGSCVMDDGGGCPRGMDGPGEVTVAISSGGLDTRSSVNYEREIQSIRIYAFKKGTDTQTGYYFSDNLLEGNGHYYCHMPLEQTGEMDFFVLVNDIGGTPAEGSVALGRNTTRSQLLAYEFTSLKNVGETSAEEHVVPMSNLSVGGTTGNNNLSFDITGNKEVPQIISLDVTRAMARIQLKFAKVGTDEVTIDKAILYHGPDKVNLTTAGKGLTYLKTNDRIDEFLSLPVLVETMVADVSNSENTYDLIAETYVLENPYGSGDLIGSKPDRDESNAYRLDITYTVGGRQRTKQIWLPPVNRNQNINILGTLVSNSLQVHLTVEDWVVDDTEINFSTEFTAELKPGLAANSLKLDTDQEGEKAIAVATSSDGIERAATFAFQMKSPVGARWTVHLENTIDFELIGTTFGYGDNEASEVEFKVVPLREHDALNPKNVNLFITVSSSFGEVGEDEGIQVINPKTDGIQKFPGTETKIRIRQVGEQAYDQLKESITRE